MAGPSRSRHQEFTNSPAVVDFAAMKEKLQITIPAAAMRGVCIVLAVMGIVVASGCVNHRATSADNPSPISTASYEQTFDASVDVLRDMGFVVDRKDYRYGVVTTRPDVSPTGVEVWHPDNTTDAQAWDSTLAYLRRRVTLQLEPVDASQLADTAQAYQLRAEVLVERRQEPMRYLTGSTRGGRIFGHLRGVPADYRRKGITGSYWEPVTRDTALEQRLIRAVQIRAEELQRQASAG